MTEKSKNTKKVAVIGSGAAGMGAMYGLSHSQHDVHLFEADSRWGGHSYTHIIEKNGCKTGVDLGFIAFNPVTYPNFMAAIKELNVEVNRPPNSLSVSRDYGRLEWCTDRIFSQKRNLISPSFWRMLFDCVRFSKIALDVLIEEAEAKAAGRDPQIETIDEYVARNRFSRQFRDDYLVPMARLIWANEVGQIRTDFPMNTLIRYLWNHNLLITVTKGYDWLSIKGGSIEYVKKILQLFPSENLHLNSPVESVMNRPDGTLAVVIRNPLDGTNRTEVFDHVILACHAPQTLDIIREGATQQEKDILGVFKTTGKNVLLHEDASVAWGSWNHQARKSSLSSELNYRASTTCWVNLEMDIPESKFGSLFTSSTPVHPIDQDLIHVRWTASHPWYTREAVANQEKMPLIQNTRGISYAGAWMAYGLHEDGFAAGLICAIDHLGAKIPWRFQDARTIEGVVPTINTRDRILRLILWIIQSVILAFV